MHFILAGYIIQKGFQQAPDFNMRDWLQNLEAEIHADLKVTMPTAETDAELEKSLIHAIANGTLYGNWPWVV